MKMKEYNSKVRCKKRMGTLVGKGGGAGRSFSNFCFRYLVLLQILIVVMMVSVVNCDGGGVVNNIVTAAVTASNSVIANLGTFLIIYSAIPHFSSSKSIRGGKEVAEPPQLTNSTLLSSPASLQNQSISTTFEPPSPSTAFASRTLQVSEENTTLSPSEEREMNLDSASEDDSKNKDDDEDITPYEEDDSAAANIREYMKKRKRRKERERQDQGSNRLKRQMGLAAEVALMAPALQTMGCIPKFFCGLNSKPPTGETTALNDLAYLIKVAMLDDDDVELEDPLFEGHKNHRGKDGLTRIKEDLIIENMAEEELIQEDPANLPFVMKDMDVRISTKTKPGNKHRLDDDILDAIIVEPEQSAMGSLFTGLKSVFRIGRSNNLNSTYPNQTSSHVSPRSGRYSREAHARGLGSSFFQSGQRRRQRWKKPPFWTTPQFRQDMELAQRIGKVEQDDMKCSTTFNVCPYTVNEMMDIVHGGYRKRMKNKRKKNGSQWYLNSKGPPKDSSEENEKPFKDPENLVTTTTEKTHWIPTDPENQIYYAIFPHKAIEKGITPVPARKAPRPNKITTTEEPDLDVYNPILGFRQGMKNKKKQQRRRPNFKIQGHVEYENDEEGSLESKKAEKLDMILHNHQKKNKQQQSKRPSLLSSWWGGGNKNPQHIQHNNRPPAPQNEGRPVPPQNQRQPPVENEENDDGEDQESSEEAVPKKGKKNENRSESAEDEEEGSSEERPKKKKATTTTPPLMESIVQTTSQPIVIGLGGFSAIQEQNSFQPQQQHPQIFIQPLQNMEIGETSIFQLPMPKSPPIATPRPKYKIQKESKAHKKSKKKESIRPQVYQSQQTPPSLPQPVGPKQQSSQKEDKSNEEASDEEENEESQENSSEEKFADDETYPQSQPRPRPNPPPPPPLRRPPIPPLRGRPSEEIREPPPPQIGPRPIMAQQHEPTDNSDEEGRNSNSAPVEGFSNEMMPMHLMMRPNTSSEYSDENHNQAGRPNMRRPVNFKKVHMNNPNHPQNSHPQQPPSPPPPPPSTTQKYSTGFLSFLFGKDKKKPKGSHEKPPQQHPYPPHNRPSKEYNDDVMDDDDDDDNDDESNEREMIIPIPNNNEPKETITGPSGKFEVGYLRPPPKKLKPNFKPPQRPQRPYRGSTSMEDSDEKRGRSTPPPPTSQNSPPQNPQSSRPLLFIGKPHRIVMPPNSAPPQFRSTTPSPMLPYITSKPSGRDSEEQDSDEEGDDESKENNSSEEKTNNKKQTRKTTTTKTKKKTSSKPATVVSSKKPGHSSSSNVIPLPPIANLGNILPGNVLAISGPVAIPDPARVPPPTTTTTTRRPPPKRKPTKTKVQNDYANSEEENDKADDSNQTKEDESDEETKHSREENKSEENSEEKDSSEETGKQEEKKPPSQPIKRRKPEDDELEHPAAKYPPLPPVGGDIAQVEEILGVHEAEDVDDEAIDGYGIADNIPAAPPLALQGFPQSLEIVVPTKAPPIRIPAFNPARPNAHTSNNGVSSVPSGLTEKQAGGTGPGNGQTGQPGSGTRDPSEQIQQGLRNPGTSSSNRGPSGNRRPGQQQGNRRPNQQQQGNKEDGDKEKNSSEENKNSSEEDDGSSEENGSPISASGFDGFPSNAFDEAILSLGIGDDGGDGVFQFSDTAGKQPPAPPIFTGSAQKQELLKRPQFLQRPVTPSPPIFYKPKQKPIGQYKLEPILKNQLPPQPLKQHQPQTVAVLPFRPSAAAILKPDRRPPSQSTSSFLVSHLLRPMLPRPNPQVTKPLDPKIVQWIRETYGIPDINNSNNPSRPSHNGHPHLGPHRTGLESENDSTVDLSNKKTKSKTKHSSDSKKTIKTKSSAEKLEDMSKEKSSKKEKTTTTTSTTTSTTTVEPPSITTIFKEIFNTEEEEEFTSLSPLSILSHVPQHSKLKSTTSPTTTTTSTTTKPTAKTTTIPSQSPSKKKAGSSSLTDYITEEEESKMAQALFDSSEEVEEEEDEEESSENEDSDEENKSAISTKVGNQKLLITVKSVTKANSKSTSESKYNSSSSKEKSVKPSKSKFASESSRESLKKKLQIKSSASTSSSKSSVREKSHSKTHHHENRTGGQPSSERDTQKKKTSPTKKASKAKARPTAFTTLSAKNTVTINSKTVSTPRPRPKRIKLPPIYGKVTRRI